MFSLGGMPTGPRPAERSSHGRCAERPASAGRRSPERHRVRRRRRSRVRAVASAEPRSPRPRACGHRDSRAATGGLIRAGDSLRPSSVSTNTCAKRAERRLVYTSAPALPGDRRSDRGIKDVRENCTGSSCAGADRAAPVRGGDSDAPRRRRTPGTAARRCRSRSTSRNPRSSSRSTIRRSAKYPFIDVHNHQDRDMSAEDRGKLVADMDRINLQVMVNLSGAARDRVREGHRNLPGRYPGRFVVFANLDFAGLEEPGWAERTPRSCAPTSRNGATGLKIYKDLGMDVKDAQRQARPGRRSAPRSGLGRTCAELGIPVLIHTADPAPFLRAEGQVQRALARAERAPRARPRPPRQTRPGSSSSAEQHDLFAEAPEARIFIDAHLGWLGERPRAARQAARRAAERLHRDRRRARRARTPAARRARLVRSSTRTG